MPAGLSWAAATDVGRRERNEDAHAGEVRLGHGLFIVCDGMGGHAHGDAASALAVSVLRRELAWALTAPWPSPPALCDQVGAAIGAANQAIFALNETSRARDRGRAGTTVVAALVRPRQACVAHVGDSRAYLLTTREATLLTLDHNVATRAIRRGEAPAEAWARPDARHLTQVLGPFPSAQLRPGIAACPLDEPALLLLCSDGVSDGGFVEREGLDRLRPLLVPAADLEAGARALVAAARHANGHDNLTALLVRMAPDG